MIEIVPDTRTKRGAHPRDAECFAAKHHEVLGAAVSDLSWLLDRDYSERAALKLVGDRYALRQRQRKAIQRGACGARAARARRAKQLSPSELAGARLEIDGYNVLLTVESALSGAFLFRGRDGVLRDLAALSRHFKRVDVTRPAVDRIAAAVDALGCDSVGWLLDRPISNSGRLRSLIERQVRGRRAAWTVELTERTDRRLAESSAIVATADSAILDRCARWFNLADHIVRADVPEARVLDWSEPDSSSPNPTR